ncbi:APC family permease [Streptomyces sp. NBC_01485]|uniref:APC family permease n=1 Tax=Streptomyces sp. NBC_01485 TaxID=2903884 RepID=UPI002E2F698D|nr:APC family permease [Streptomyces sp. NBC_01485]
MATSPRPTVQPSREADGDRKLSGSIGVGSLVFMVLAGAAPLTVAAVSTPLGILVGNGSGYPFAYIAAAVILAFFAVGFVAMTPHVREAGAFYSYVTRGLGRRVGVGAGLLALLTYTANLVGVLGFIGLAITNVLDRYGMSAGPWWLWTAVVIALVGVLGHQRIDLSGKVLGLLLVAEVAIVVVLDLAIFFKGGPHGYSTGIVDPGAIVSGSPALGLMFAIGGFVGFEATAIYRDEARDPQRTVPRATYLALALVGGFYAVTGWLLVTAWGDGEVVGRAAKDPSTLLADTAQNYLGTVAADVINVLIVTSLLACALSLHNVLARYYFNLGNTQVMPARLGKPHHRLGSPSTASLLQSVICAVAITICALAGLDPVVQIATWFTGIMAVGIVMLMLLTCCAVLVFFRRNKVDTRVWQTLLAPALGVAGLGIVMVVMVQNLPLLMGGSDRLGVIAAVVLVVTPLAGIALAHVRPNAGTAPAGPPSEASV